MKKGQVTLFVFVAILVVGVIGVGYFIVNSSSKAKLNEEYFNQPSIRDSMFGVQDSILHCRDDVSKTALDVIGVQGGYYHMPQRVFDIGWAFFPYYYYEGQFLNPTRDEIQHELALYVDEQFEKCLAVQDFGLFTVDVSDISTSATILDDSVYFEIDAPLTITHEDNTIIIEMQDFPKEYNLSLSDMLDIAEYLTDSHHDDPALYCITCVATMARERDLYVDIVAFDSDGTMMTVITDNKTFIDPYSFVFLNKYSGTEVSPDVFVSETAPDAPSDV